MLVVMAYEEKEMLRGIFEEKDSYNEAYDYIHKLAFKGCRKFSIIDLCDNAKFDIVDVDCQCIESPKELIFTTNEQSVEFSDRLNNEVYQIYNDSIYYPSYIVMAYDVFNGRFNSNKFIGIGNAKDYIEALADQVDLKITLTNLDNGETLNFTASEGELEFFSEEDEMRFHELIVEELEKVEKYTGGCCHGYYINLW